MTDPKPIPVPLAERGVTRITRLPPPTTGFIGAGHTAIHVMSPADFAMNDPFLLFADDRLDLPPGSPAGSAHPHGGFEIATFVVAGELDDRDEGLLRAGDVAFVSAGSGVVHNENVRALGSTRILQLWFTLPSVSRWAEPRFAVVNHAQAPAREEPGVEARVYSGTSGDVSAPLQTHLPLLFVDVRMAANAVFDEAIPAGYNGFLYPVDGNVLAGRTVPAQLTAGQIGWLDGNGLKEATSLRLTAGPEGARVLLYAGERQNVPVVTHGPFVAESRADLQRLGLAYTQGRLPRISEIARRQRMTDTPPSES